MDLTTLGGVVFAIAMILGGQVLEGGHAGSLVQLTAFMIVVGGTIGATAVAVPSADLKHVVTAFKIALAGQTDDRETIIAKIVEFAGVARKEGVLALEQQMGDIEDPFMKKALSFVVDGVDGAVVRESLETAAFTEFETKAVGAKILEAAGGFSPTIGIIGAVLGLIHVMENLSDPSALGPGIAVAFVATVYGVGLANILLLPMGGKVKRKAMMEKARKDLITEGVIGIQEGLNPRILEDKLRALAGSAESEAEGA